MDIFNADSFSSPSLRVDAGNNRDATLKKGAVIDINKLFDAEGKGTFIRSLGPVKIKEDVIINPSLSVDRDMVGEFSTWGNHFIRENNAVYKDWPVESILTNSRYRLADAYGMSWNGPIRTLGLLTHVRKPKLIGYVVTREPLVSLPDLKDKLTYPLGSASVRLDKTHQDLRCIHGMMPIYSSFDIALDVSVSEMVEDEGKFLRNVTSPHQFGCDVLKVHAAANDLRGDFLASAIEGHNDIYMWGCTEYCIKHSAYGIQDLSLAAELLASLVGSYNNASMGVKYQFLSSKAMPDPIQVGNYGDLNGNMASPSGEIDLSGQVSKLASGALDFLTVMFDSPTNGDIGVAKNDGSHSTGPGWVKPPAPDGGMTWNLSHLQAAYHLDGTTIVPPVMNWYEGHRGVVVNDVISEKLKSAGEPGSGELRLASEFGDNYVFIPAIRYERGYSDLIRQDGAVINLLVDRYDPEVDSDNY